MKLAKKVHCWRLAERDAGGLLRKLTPTPRVLTDLAELRLDLDSTTAALRRSGNWFQGAARVSSRPKSGGNELLCRRQLPERGRTAAGSISNWLISPELTLGGANSRELLCSHGRLSKASADTVKVYFNAGSGRRHGCQLHQSAGHRDPEHLGAWTQYTFALPSAATGRIAFEYAVSRAPPRPIWLRSTASASAAVPEPASFALMGLGRGWAWLFLRRRQGLIRN